MLTRVRVFVAGIAQKEKEPMTITKLYQYLPFFLTQGKLANFIASCVKEERRARGGIRTRPPPSGPFMRYSPRSSHRRRVPQCLLTFTSDNTISSR